MQGQHLLARGVSRVSEVAWAPMRLWRCRKHPAMSPPASSHQGKPQERLVLWAGLARLKSLRGLLMNFPCQ